MPVQTRRQKLLALQQADKGDYTCGIKGDDGLLSPTPSDKYSEREGSEQLPGPSWREPSHLMEGDILPPSYRSRAPSPEIQGPKTKAKSKSPDLSTARSEVGAQNRGSRTSSREKPPFQAKTPKRSVSMTSGQAPSDPEWEPPLVIGASLGQNLSAVELARRRVAQREAIYQKVKRESPGSEGPIRAWLEEAQQELDLLPDTIENHTPQ
jgi:hypothetical protein